jgi:hypothetical protein
VRLRVAAESHLSEPEPTPIHPFCEDVANLAVARLLPALLFWNLAPCAIAGAEPEASPATAAASSATSTAVVLNVRDFGAIGDGRVHLVREWIDQHRFSNLRQLKEKFPFVDDLDWSVDEVAFTAAKRALPANGGTIHFPVGHYIAARQSWQIWQDHVRLTGDGADRTILSTTPEIADGMSVAPYRHIGWLEGAKQEYPFSADSGSRGDDAVQLLDPRWGDDFHRGDLVFIRSGANRYDQDYGEFNEVASVDPDGQLQFKYPLARDYTLEKFNGASVTKAPFKMPGADDVVGVKLSSEAGNFVPAVGNTISIGTDLFRVTKVFKKDGTGTASVVLEYFGRGDTSAKTEIPTGTPIGKSRAVVRVTKTTRDFRCENLQIVGRRKALSISNTYECVFADCIFVRNARDRRFKGGLTIDGDGGRFARFERCKIIAEPSAGMQFARSFGNVVFTGCTFSNSNVAFTEFNFDCEVTRCRFDVVGGHGLNSVVIAGKSCGNLRFIDNQIRATKVTAIFDTHSDIQSQKHGSEGDVLIRGNTIETTAGLQVFPSTKSERFAVEDNRVIQ